MTGEPAPLGVYIHWPYCARICPYCDFNVVRDRGRTDEPAALAQAIGQDLRGHRAMTGERRLTSIYFGGGTPSLMRPAAAQTLIALACSLWTPADDLEVTLEANPTDAEAGRFVAFADAGVTRLSLGVQALDDGELAFLGRNHDASTARRAVEAARGASARLSLDLIYALPGQTVDAWERTLRQAVDLGAEHLSPYQLTIEAGTAFDRAVGRGRLAPVDPDLAADLYEATQALLEAQGFSAYEVSNHARGETARSRHNLGYWRGWDYAGVGPGAHGRLTLDAARVATVAAPRIADYLAAVTARGVGFAAPGRLSLDQVAEERLLMGLRTHEGVAFSELAPLGLTPSDARVRELGAQGLVATTAGRLIATSRGRRVLDSVTRALAA